jgi:serine protease DegQ
MRKTWLIFSQAVTVLLAAWFVVATLKPQWLSRQREAISSSTAALPSTAPVLSNSAPKSVAGAVSYAQAAKRATPAVVSITASKPPERPSSSGSGDPFFDFFFGDRSGAERQGERQTGLGSGVIVSEQGYLLTNNHVIEGADDIEVALVDGRQAKAKLIGTDPDTDVAVLKIELDKLPVISFGQVDTLQVGDVVLAIGNPFGVGQTVTSGIVSALGRNQLGINTFENFIQTDAAINPGNSGGALVDAQGQLLGINTAIYSRSGGNLGIGFAVPANTALQVMEGLIKDGQVTRGWIGVEPRDLTPEMAEALNLKTKQGVLITGVLQSGPASAGGMLPGDVVVTIAGKTVNNTAQLLNKVAEIKPQTRTLINVRRADETVELTVTVGQRPKARAPRER